jgi:sulfoxide reductase heme-binding subunit YedZ
MTGSALWYLARGSGIVSLLLLTVTVVLGVTTSTRWAGARLTRAVVAGLHRNVSLLVLVFLGLHVATVVLDGYVDIGWADTVLPFLAGWRPLWVGLGTVAIDLLLAIAVTSLLRARVGRRAWRAVHWLAYACWPLALAHGLGAGSDSGQAWVLALDAAAVAAVGGAVAWRLHHPGRRPLPVPTASGGSRS